MFGINVNEKPFPNFILDKIDETWKPIFIEEFQKPYFQNLISFLNQEWNAGHTIYPPKHLIFNAFEQTSYHQVKVVFVGQDPYHNEGQAHGLCFSVPKGVTFPPSLKNIFREMTQDLNIPMPQHGCLESWAHQGVLLLNTTLTVRKGAPLSHHKKGWEQFTDEIILKLCKKAEPIIFVLWGKSALNKWEHIVPSYQCQTNESQPTPHIILHAPHPSPLSAYQGFFGCCHFSKINQYLIQFGKKPIDWVL